MPMTRIIVEHLDSIPGFGCHTISATPGSESLRVLHEQALSLPTQIVTCYAALFALTIDACVLCTDVVHQ
jgi:hypothetical protein